MANVRDSDTSLWLHNKLGTSNDSWTGGSICSQLNAEVLRNIKECFPDLQTQVKLKLLLSFFHIPRRNVAEVSHLIHSQTHSPFYHSSQRHKFRLKVFVNPSKLQANTSQLS